MSDKSSLIILRTGGGGRQTAGGGEMSFNLEGVTLDNLTLTGSFPIFRKITSGWKQRLLKLSVFNICLWLAKLPGFTFVCMHGFSL